jgi:hypothetical protein
MVREQFEQYARAGWSLLEVPFSGADRKIMAIEEESKDIIQCPYLDTVNRHILDFDFEKICSVTLSTTNVYACLVCGVYFQGSLTFPYSG